MSTLSGGSPLPHPLMPHPPLQVIVFNTVREMLGSHMPQGTVALCEGNPRLFVNTAQGWLRAEVYCILHLTESSPYLSPPS